VWHKVTPVRYAVKGYTMPYIILYSIYPFTGCAPTPVRYAVCPWVATVTQGYVLYTAGFEGVPPSP
jgi:hypothetical protein